MFFHRRSPFRSIHFFLILAPVLASVIPFSPGSGQSIPEGHESNDTLLIQHAGLRRLLETIDDHQLGPLETVCLLISEEGTGFGSGETSENRPQLERFLEDEFHLRTRPSDACVSGEGSRTRRPNRLFRDAETGEPAALLKLSEPTFRGRDSASVQIGFHLGPLWGRGGPCELERTEDGWSIIDCRDAWVS